MNKLTPMLAAMVFLAASLMLNIEATHAQEEAAEVKATDKPQLFLVGDSIMQTGRDEGAVGPWGWGSELDEFFDTTRIEVLNKARGGRSSRSFINEGHWDEILAELNEGDFVIVGFGHNDTVGSQGHPNRATIAGGGEETIVLGVGNEREVVHTYGWYMRRYAREAKAKGATVIITSPVPRRKWEDGKIVRGFDGYAQWAREAAEAEGAVFIDLNSLAADQFDALGEQTASANYNDTQHTKKGGAQINARCVAGAIEKKPELKALAQYLKD